MRIVTYDLEKDENDMPMLVKNHLKIVHLYQILLRIQGKQ